MGHEEVQACLCAGSDSQVEDTMLLMMFKGHAFVDVHGQIA